MVDVYAKQSGLHYASCEPVETLRKRKLCDDTAYDSTEVGYSCEVLAPRRQLVDDPKNQGIENVRKVMENDMASRYQAKNSLNFVLQCERYLAKYLGMKYALALNSGGVAIRLGLEGLKHVFYPHDALHDIRIYSNAFTFHAVPSACVIAGFYETLQLIEATSHLTIDLDHLEACICEDLKSGKFAKGKMILVLSYMRGRIPDMHRVMDLCKKYHMHLLEDCAHGYGCTFAGQMCGSFGIISTISSQAAKLVNTGDGGMIFTSNSDLQAFFIFSAGSYEELWMKHEEMAPSKEVSLKYQYTVTNKSVRMTNIQAALMYPQLLVINMRIQHYNSIYAHLASHTDAKMRERCGEKCCGRIHFIDQAHKLVGPVYDSLQVRILGEDGCAGEKEFDGLDNFLEAMQARKQPLTKFSDPSNARNCMSWRYLKNGEMLSDVLPQTMRVLTNTCDIRLHCRSTKLEMEKLATDLVECFQLHMLQ